MLSFLNDLSKFSKAFGGAQAATDGAKQENTPPPPKTEQPKESAEDKKNPQSPTAGIADDFIQTILDSYLKGVKQ